MSIFKRKSTDDTASRTPSRPDDDKNGDYETRLDPADLLAEYLAPDETKTADRSGKLDFGDSAEQAEAPGALTANARTTSSSTHDDDHDHDHGDDDDIFEDHHLHEHGDPGDDFGGGDGADGPLPSIGDHELDQLMDTLNRSGKSWDNDGTGLTLTFAFPQSTNDFPDDHLAEWDWTKPSADGLDPFTSFNAVRQAHTIEALSMWESVADITFEQVAPGEVADIYFFGREYDDGGAYSMGVQQELGSAIRVNTAASTWNSMEVGAGGFTTMMHEIGHSLGLSHPGDYDVGDGATYDTHADYVEDSNMYSIMSYFGAANTGATYGGWENVSEDTPRGHDIYVAQQLYGANWGTRNGDTTYGFNTTESGSLYDFDQLALLNEFFDNTEDATGVNLKQRGPVLTIWDGGGDDDWLDLSGDDNDVMLDLAPGAFSSTHGMTYNISLAYHPADAHGQYGHYIENAQGGSGDDTIYGNELANELIGGAGDDEIFGQNGADTLSGGDGDDTLNGGFGDDVLYGGDGHDTADYSYSDVGWTIDLGFAPIQTASNDWGTEVLTFVESAITGEGDDEVTGGNGANQFETRGGNDTLTGNGGDDTLRAGDDNDQLYGGAGDDFLEGGEGDDFVYGGSGDDMVWSDEYSWTNPTDFGDDNVYAGSGDDYVNTSGGDDYVNAGSGDDTVYGGHGNDTIRGSHGEDDLNGGQGVDEVDFSDVGGDWHIDLLANSASSTWQSGPDSIDNFEQVRTGAGDDTVKGEHGAETFWAGSGDDDVEGRAGDDVLLGEGGHDILNGGGGDDIVSGGSGTDMASYQGASSGVLVDLAFDGFGQNTFGAGEDTLISIERLEGSGHGDILSGDNGLNHIHGEGGDDVLFGRGGNDWVNGGSGDDILEGGEGNDIITGGDGEDAVSYFFASAGVNVDLSDNGAQNTFGAGTDVISSVEHAIGSFHNDWLAGNDGDNRLTGGAGEDVLVGGEGADSLNGGDDDDVLVGGAGNDVMDGGDGVDWVFFNTNAPNGVDVDLAKEVQWTKQGSDTIRNVENILGSSQDDDLRGDDASNEIWGGGGDDTLVGAGGEDTLKGGHGDDMIYVGNDAPWEGPGGFIPTPKPEAKTEIDTFVFEGFDPEGDPVAEFQMSAAASGGTNLFRVSHPSGAAQTLEGGDVTMASIGGVDVSADQTAAKTTAHADSLVFNPDGGGGGGVGRDAAVGGIKVKPGSGPDVVVFDAGWGDDQVFGFTTGADRLDFSSISALDLIDLDVSDTADGALIEYGSNSVLLHDVFANALTDGDFIV